MELIWKTFRLLICQILGVFVNTLTATGKYLVRDFENFPPPTQMQLSEKQKKNFQFFIPFHKSSSNFKHFEKKDDRYSLCISEITDCQRLA